MVDPKSTGGVKAMKRRGVGAPKQSTPTEPEQPSKVESPSPTGLTSFGSLVSELNSPTSSVGRLNRSKEFMEGFEMSRLGRAKGRNPYPKESTEFNEWQDGWETKYYGEAL